MGAAEARSRWSFSSPATDRSREPKGSIELREHQWQGKKRNTKRDERESYTTTFKTAVGVIEAAALEETASLRLCINGVAGPGCEAQYPRSIPKARDKLRALRRQ
jgi:hypothetical protein